MGARKDGEVKAVDLQCSYNGRWPYSGAESGTAPFRQRLGYSRATGFSFSTTITRQRLQEQPYQWSIKVTREEHDRDPFEDIKVYPRGCALAEEQKQSVIASLRAGICSGRIVASLWQSSIAGVIARDI